MSIETSHQHKRQVKSAAIPRSCSFGIHNIIPQNQLTLWSTGATTAVPNLPLITYKIQTINGKSNLALHLSQSMQNHLKRVQIGIHVRISAQKPITSPIKLFQQTN